MKQLYAHKSFVGEVERAEKDGTIFMFQEEIPYKVGELIFTGVNNEQQILSESTFKNYFIPVEKRKANVDLDEMAKGYMEMAYLNQEEDEDYIVKTKALISDKPC